MGAIQVRPEHYLRSYDSKGRFCSYWAQIAAITAISRPPILEVGVGNGLVSHYLKHLQLPVVTLDLDRALQADVQGDILALPFGDASFGTVVACQVLEHLPFAQFPQALRELARVSSSHVLISLPNNGRTFRLFIDFPLARVFRPMQKLMSFSWLRRRRTVAVKDQHYWELEIPGYPIARIRGAINSSGLAILQDFRVFELPFHHFFVMQKARGDESRRTDAGRTCVGR